MQPRGEHHATLIGDSIVAEDQLGVDAGQTLERLRDLLRHGLNDLQLVAIESRFQAIIAES